MSTAFSYTGKFFKTIQVQYCIMQLLCFCVDLNSSEYAHLFVICSRIDKMNKKVRETKKSFGLVVKVMKMENLTLASQ